MMVVAFFSDRRHLCRSLCMLVSLFVTVDVSMSFDFDYACCCASLVSLNQSVNDGTNQLFMLVKPYAILSA